jgi:hypothetical protein
VNTLTADRATTGFMTEPAHHDQPARVTVGRLLRVLLEMNLITRVNHGRDRLSSLGREDGGS